MNTLKPLLLAVVVALATPHVVIGALVSLGDDSTALSGWHGSTSYDNGLGLAGTIDYAVYAPGTFPGGFSYVPASLGGALIPGDYVYTYQVHETGGAFLSELSVTLTGPADVLSIGTFTGTHVIGADSVFVDGAPTLSTPFITPLDSAVWNFDKIIGSTVGLAFSSPFGPTSATARTTDDGTNAFTFPLPSPVVPEPAMLTIYSCGLAVLVLHRLWRRGRKTSL